MTREADVAGLVDQLEYAAEGEGTAIVSKNFLREVIAALSAESVAGDEATLVPNWLILFLRGEDHWPGHPEVWFGDAHPTERGKFFWRRHMASAPLKAVILSHAAPAGGER